MPRRPRQNLEGTVFHVVSRGVAGQLIFEDDFDRSRFVWQLNEVSERFGWRVIAWCLMERISTSWWNATWNSYRSRCTD